MIGRILGWLRGHRRPFDIAVPSPGDGAAAQGERDVDPETGAGPFDFSDPDAVVAVAITDELDLHHFAPREVGDLVTEYLDAAQAEGLTVVRIIHGKGIGALRRTVHAVLARHPAVLSHRPGGDREGGWGATIVTLRPRT